MPQYKTLQILFLIDDQDISLFDLINSLTISFLILRHLSAYLNVTSDYIPQLMKQGMLKALKNLAKEYMTEEQISEIEYEEFWEG